MDGTFKYTFNYDLGPTNLSASEYMAKVADNFGEVFPIKGRPSTLPDVGADLDLEVAGVGFPVYISRRSANGWVFGTRFGHPDHSGWLAFAFTRTKDGRMRLRIHGYVPDYALGACSISPSCWVFRKRIYRGVAGRVWAPFAANLRERAW